MTLTEGGVMPRGRPKADRLRISVNAVDVQVTLRGGAGTGRPHIHLPVRNAGNGKLDSQARRLIRGRRFPCASTTELALVGGIEAVQGRGIKRPKGRIPSIDRLASVNHPDDSLIRGRTWSRHSRSRPGPS